MDDIAAFLRAHDPFGELDDEAAKRLAESAEVEFFAAGMVIFEQGDAPQRHVRVVRSGAVELVDRGRVVDLLAEGEPFGHPSMLSGLPTGFEARAREDSLCYSFVAAEVVPLLTRPLILQSFARSLLGRGTLDIADGANAPSVVQQPARELIRQEAVTCSPDDSLREAAERMVREGASSVVVCGDEGVLGIVTESDWASRVVAGGMPLDAPVRDVMTAPVLTVGVDQTRADVLLTMLGNDVHHVPVLSPRSEVLGVVAATDLVAVEAHAPFLVRRAIADARTKAELREAAAGVRPMVVALHRSDLAPAHTSSAISVVGDALIRRMIALAIELKGAPPSEFAWLSVGSHGRREPVPSSDVDSGMSWWATPTESTNAYMHSIAEDVAGCLRVVGWRIDAHGANAKDEFGANSIEEWRAAIRRWLSVPEDNRILIATSILLDGRAAYGPEELNPKAIFYEVGREPALLRWLLRLALAARPPIGFMRDLVVEHSGEHRGTLDIKHGGLLPILDLARYAALKADTRVTSTVERLRAAGQAGALTEAQVETLTEAHELFSALRLEHQVCQIEHGLEPDDFLDPKELNPLARRHLRDAFREVAAIQKTLAAQLTWST